jgi:hypothetical protein
MDRMAKKSWPVRGAQTTLDVAALGTVFGASGIIAMSKALTTGLAVFTAKAPDIAGRIQQEQIPIASNFEELYWREAVKLNPGQTALRHVFTAHWDQPHFNSFIIDTENVQKIKVVQ